MSDLLKDFGGQFGKDLISLEWKDLGLGNNLRRGADKLNSELDAITQYYAPQIEGWMKTNAKWTDRTGNARNGLAARAYSTGTEHGIVLYHQVPYGIYLEVRYSGKYGIIIPALEEWGPRVMDGAKGILSKIGS